MRDNAPSLALLAQRNRPQVPEPRRPIRPDVVHDPLLLVAGWNHQCGVAGCPTWVPNHLPACATHQGSDHA